MLRQEDVLKFPFCVQDCTEEDILDYMVQLYGFNNPKNLYLDYIARQRLAYYPEESVLKNPKDRAFYVKHFPWINAFEAKLNKK